MKDIKNNKNEEYDTLSTITLKPNNTKLEHESKYENDKDIPIIDKIFEEKGYSGFTLMHIILTFSILAVEGLHMTLFSSMIIPLSSLYALSENDIKFLSSILFVGVGIGSLFSGAISSKFSRIKIINIFLFVIYICNIGLAFSDNFILFSIFRFIIGLGLGMIVPMSLNLLTECLPITNRSLVLNFVWIAFSLGNLYNLMIMLGIMPYLETSKVKDTVLLCSLCPLIVFLINYFNLTDSPRNLIINNKEDEAIKILEKISKKKIDDIKRSIIISQVKSGINNEEPSKLKEIFNKKNKKLTSLLIIIWFFNSMIGYGPGLISSLTISSLGMTENFTNYEIITNQIIICIICSPSTYLGGILSEISFLGRNRSTILGYFVSLIFINLAIFYPNYFTLMFGLSQAFASIAFNINTTYSCEVYPTKIRDNALGFLFFATRVGGFSSQIMYLAMNNIGIWIPYYFTIVITIINIAFIYLLPYETLGKPLDMNYGSSSCTSSDSESDTIDIKPISKTKNAYKK
jgi:MFS family permease